MSEAYDRIKEGLDEALAFAQGEETGAVVHMIEVPRVDVAAIRATTGLSQAQFAKSIGVAKGTLLNWEHAADSRPGQRRCCLQ